MASSADGRKGGRCFLCNAFKAQWRSQRLPAKADVLSGRALDMKPAIKKVAKPAPLKRRILIYKMQRIGQHMVEPLATS
jgi:hypothetical protein